jgi:hypothetical protein
MDPTDIEKVLKRLSHGEIQRIKKLSEVESRRLQLKELKRVLEANQRIIPIISFLKLTKTENMYSESYLLRDIELEKSVESYLASRSSYSQIISKYNQYDKSVKWII